MFTTNRGMGEEADYSKPSIKYSIDGKLFAMSGQPWRDGGRIDFDAAAARIFLDRLKEAKGVFAFAVGTKKEMSFIDVSPGYVERDVEQLEGHCPTAAK